MDSSLIHQDLDKLIKEELGEWKKMGIADPAQAVSSNSFLDSVKLMAMCKLLVDKEIVTDDDMQIWYKKQMLESLKEARDGLTTARMNYITKGITH